MLPAQYQWIFKLNPLFYITEGYRYSFIYHQWFWELGYVNLTFWLITVSIMVIGAVLFKRLRPHFADVL